MKAPTGSIALEALQGEDALARLLDSLNPFMGALSSGLSNQLSFSENFRAELKVLDVKVPDPAWTAPTLQNGWVPLGGVNQTPGYRIDPTGRVHVRGIVQTGTPPSTVFTLPLGFRPPEGLVLATASNNAYGTLTVNPNGNVDATTGSGINFSLACSFQAATPAPPPAFVGPGWPLYFSTRLDKEHQARIVLPVAVADVDGGLKTTHGGASVDWLRTGDGRIKVKSVWGLTPGRAYKLTVLVTAW